MNLISSLDHTIPTFIAGITHIVVQLRNLEVQVADSQIIAKILTSLPPSFNHFGAAWDSTPEDQRTLPNLKTCLVKEERAIKSRHNGKADPVDVAYFGSSTNPPVQAVASPIDQSTLPQAFPAGNFNNFRGGKGNKGGRGGSYRGRGGFSNGGGFHPYANGKRGSHSGNHQREGSNSNPPVCYNCNRPGHIQRNCWFLNSNKQHQNDGEQKSFSYQSISISSPKRYTLVTCVFLSCLFVLRFK